jgi:ribonucleoside-diphosphate reductase alpha chain
MEVYMKIEQIKKRSGEVVDFDPAKIDAAITMAFEATYGGFDQEIIQIITGNVVSDLVEMTKSKPSAILGVEDIQDIVEREIVAAGFFEASRAYIIYRHEHTKVREEKKAKEVRQTQKMIEKQTLQVVKRSGKKENFSADKVRKTLEYAAFGLPIVSPPSVGVDIDGLVNQITSDLYDGITTSEIAKALTLTARSWAEKDSVYSFLATRLLHFKLYREIIGPKINFKKLDVQYREAFERSIKKGVAIGKLDERMLEFDLSALSKIIDPKRDDLFKYLGAQTLYDRYYIRNSETKEILETPQAMWMRVAMGLAINEKDREKWAAKFYEVMSTLRYVPSTPTLFHAGTGHPQLSSCYLNTVSDDLIHIFKVIGDNAQLSKWSGGIGTDWTYLRGTGALIRGIGVESQGVIPFLKVANDATHAINRSGRRRGAACVYLETWHYDIESFLELRKNTGDERRRTHDIDTANWIPDLFMRRVRDNAKWTLFSPDETTDLHDLYGKAFTKRYQEYEKMAQEGKIKLTKTIPAKELWKKMLAMLFETGHPWITFKDPSNIRSPQDHAGVVHCSNLCTEITLNTSAEETAVCNLGSVNLARHLKLSGSARQQVSRSAGQNVVISTSRSIGSRNLQNSGAFTSQANAPQDDIKNNIDNNVAIEQYNNSTYELDNEKLAETVTTAMRMLDNVVDINFYPTVEGKNSNLRHRPVGLGIMGFHDALYQQNINFDSEAAVDFADSSQEIIAYHAYLASSNLAKERGAYDSFKGSKWDRGILPQDTLDLLEKERGEKIEISRIERMDWQKVRDSIKRYGMRNSNCLAIAPTATISNIAGSIPTIEPIYKNIYVKSNVSGDFIVINDYLVNDLKKLGLWDEAMI